MSQAASAEYLEEDQNTFVQRYLTRIEVDQRPPRTAAGLQSLMVANLIAIPFENLDIFSRQWSAKTEAEIAAKILDHRRGGWCFELNGAFARLLSALGFEVQMLGAAVLLAGPNRVIDHLTLEVTIDAVPYLVDVGFGDGFAAPLPLNAPSEEPLDGGTGSFGFYPSSEGTTLVRFDADGSPVPQYRFRRVSLALSDFQPAADSLAADPNSTFRRGPLATRLLNPNLDRVTLSTDRLRLRQGGKTTDTELTPASESWRAELTEWFGACYARALHPETVDPEAVDPEAAS